MDYIKMKTGGRRRHVNNFLGGADMRFDEGVVSESSAVMCKNFRFESGALTGGYGLESDLFYEGRRIWSVWDFVRYDFTADRYVTIKMLCDAAGRVMYYDNMWRVLGGVVFTSPPRALVYRLYGTDTVIMTSDTDEMVVWSGTGAAQRITGSPLITSFAMHYERMFATTVGEQNKVYFSDDLDPTNWNETLTEGGYIQLLDERGKLLKVVDFLNYVYIFREYGVSRLVAYADQQEFYVVNLYVAGGKVYAGSVAQTGSGVMLLGSDGLYSFDGYDMTRRLKNIEFDASPDASAVYADGRYYLAARVKGFSPSAGTANNALVVYDTASGGYSVSEISAARLMRSGDSVYAATYANELGRVVPSGMVFGDPLESVWESGYGDFGTPARKTLKEITLTSARSAILTVIADGKEYTYIVAGGATPMRVKPTIAAHRFKFRIRSFERNANIQRMSYVLN